MNLKHQGRPFFFFYFSFCLNYYLSRRKHLQLLSFWLYLCFGLMHTDGLAVNLAVALANKFHLKVGLLDADVYGPNVPIMMKINSKPEVTEGTSYF